MTEKTFKTPITALYRGQYVPPGTEITLPETEANAFIARHGEYDGPRVNDKDGKQAAADNASIDALNEFTRLQRGIGLPHDYERLKAG
jgi:hypothetical protein